MQSQKQQNDLYSFSRQTIQYCSNPSNAEEAEVEWFYEDLQDCLEITLKKVVLFIIGDWNAKAKIQVIPGVMGTFGLGVQNETGQSLTVLPREHCPRQVEMSFSTLSTFRK